MPNKQKLSGTQHQKDQNTQQQNHQQQKTKAQAPKKAKKQEVFHEHERIETRMTD